MSEVEKDIKRIRELLEELVMLQKAASQAVSLQARGSIA